ncbi:unnamed protein product [Amaranthus hypochondriacus]
MILFFAGEPEVEKALSDSSPLWTLFDDVRRWSEGEIYNDRVVWLECFGVHPQCGSDNTLRLIGEKWGPVLRIDREFKGVPSISYARLLVHTRAQNKVDARIRLNWDGGACDVWVKELTVCVDSMANNEACCDGRVNMDPICVQGSMGCKGVQEGCELVGGLMGNTWGCEGEGYGGSKVSGEGVLGSALAGGVGEDSVGRLVVGKCDLVAGGGVAVDGLVVGGGCIRENGALDVLAAQQQVRAGEVRVCSGSNRDMEDVGCQVFEDGGAVEGLAVGGDLCRVAGERQGVAAQRMEWAEQVVGVQGRWEDPIMREVCSKLSHEGDVSRINHLVMVDHGPCVGEVDGCHWEARVDFANRQEVGLAVAAAVPDCVQLSCPVMGDVAWAFDPMLLPDALSVGGASLRVNNDAVSFELLKKPRGRPKKTRACMVSGHVLGSTCTEEVDITWGVAKQLGLDSSHEATFMEGLRKSKRLSIMEDQASRGR